jgi:DNA-binding IscR family transcriptional regulator
MATSAEVGEAIGSHPVVVRRVLGGLRSSGFVESRPGRHGGWAIAKDPAKIRVGDVYRALDDKLASPASALDEVLLGAERNYVKRLDEATLADLAQRDASTPDS